MHLRKHITGIFSCMGILVLILDGKTALAGAMAGMELCMKTVIPSLFPFLFLCSLLTNSLWGLQGRCIAQYHQNIPLQDAELCRRGHGDPAVALHCQNIHTQFCPDI